MKPIDMVGRKFGRLVVLEKAASTRHGLQWSCLCSCGSKLAVYGDALRAGRQQSCGCYNQESRHARATHGESNPKTVEYTLWCAMHDRCSNPRNPHYRNYGGRGIRVCRRWQRYEHFLADMGRRPDPKLTLERVDNDKGYSPSNCCWATRKQQSANRRCSK